MISKEEQQNREEMLSQFIDKLNHENKPSISGVEEDKELLQLFDTVRAVKRFGTDDAPDVPRLKSNTAKRRWKGILKYGSLAACVIIVFFAVAGNRGKLGACLYTNDSGFAGKGQDERSAENKEEKQDLTQNGDNTQLNSAVMQKGSSESIAAVYTSCSAAASFLGGLPNDLRISRVIKLTDSPYTYCVSCKWDEVSFMDVYILPGTERYGMEYKNSCYSFMDGIIEENTDIGMKLRSGYGTDLNTLSWSGDSFTIMIATDRENHEVISMLEGITGYKAIPLSLQEMKDLQEESDIQ